MLSLGKLSFALMFMGAVPYTWQIFHGKVRPERASWFVWFILGFIALSGQIAAGGDDSLWMTIAQTIITGLIFVISIFKGSGGFTKFDLKCLALASVGLILWRISNQPAAAIAGVIFADAMGVLPTIRKSYYEPETELLFSWVVDMIAAGVGVLSVGQFNITLIAYPFYIFVSGILVVYALLMGRRRRTDAA